MKVPVFSLVKEYFKDIKERLIHIEDKVNYLMKSQEQGDRTKTTIFNTNPLNIEVGFLIRGGLGDFLIAINYIYNFYHAFREVKMKITLVAHVSPAVLKTLVECINEEIEIEVIDEKYFSNERRIFDIYIDLARYPDLKYYNETKIVEKSIKLLDYIFAMKKFRIEHSKMFSFGGDMGGQSAELSILNGQKRINQPDIYKVFGMGENFMCPLKIERSVVLDDIDADSRFITIHRGCDANHSSYSTKLWPQEYYEIIVKLIKKTYPNISIVQLGVNNERCPRIEGVDYSLVGKTSIKELMYILSKASLHIDGEGGMVHLRHAVHGGKSIVLFGPTSPEFFGYEENENIKGTGCKISCEWITRNWQDKCIRGGKAHCMYSITPEFVMGKVKESIDGK